MTRRIDVEFPSGGVTCRAWLYLPDDATPRPIIVMGHGLGGLRIMRLDAYAERFCAARYACLVFDYRHFGDSDGEPRHLLDIEHQLQDWAAAIAHARSRADVDGSRVVLWGTSFGGGHVLQIAATDHRIAAVISQCPFTDGVASGLAVDPVSSLKVLAYGIADRMGSVVGRAPILLPSAGPPRSAAFMTTPDALAGVAKLMPPGHPPDPTPLAARAGLAILRYRPGTKTPAIECPVLFCVCDADRLAPAKATLRHAARARRGEIKRYSIEHFDIYVGPDFERAIVDQLDFLRRHVP